MRRGWARTIAAGGALLAAALVAVSGFALLPPAAALAASDTTDPSALVLTGDAPGTVHRLEPGVPSLWNVGVTLRRMPVSTLVGIVAAAGGFATAGGASVPVDVELLGCTDAWSGDVCASGARIILPTTPTSALPSAEVALADPRRAVPARLYVQARVTLDPAAPVGTSGELRVRLTVDAMGAGAAAPGGPLPAAGAPASLAGTGSAPLGAALLALAAVLGGFAVAALARRNRDA